MYSKLKKAVVICLCLAVISTVLPINAQAETPELTSMAAKKAKKIKNLRLTLTNYNEVTLTWSPAGQDSEYKIYRSLNPDSGFKLVTEAYGNEYKDQQLAEKTTYYYKIKMKDAARGSYESAVKSITTKEKQIILDAAAAGPDKIRLTWGTIPDVETYIIYRSDSKDGEYTNITTCTDFDNDYEDTGLEFGKEYFYKAEAYRYELPAEEYQYSDDYQEPEDAPYPDDSNTENWDSEDPWEEKKVLLAGSDIVSAATGPGEVTITSSKVKTIRSMEIKWDKTEYAEGYEIYISDNEFEGYKKVKTVKKDSPRKVELKGLKEGTLYYCKVAAYGMKDGKKIPGVQFYGTPCLMNYYGNKYEDYDQKLNRIYSGGREKKYKNAKQAARDMKTIKIKTWDINSSGKKYTRTWSLTVHKNIAPTVQQIFKEIYSGKEKFPIHNIGGYQWRTNGTSEHCSGLAIDINPTENYMIDGGVVKSGKFWKPGKNPYSIKEDGDVVRIMERYGFSWGIWGERRDYMHFSYFGV